MYNKGVAEPNEKGDIINCLQCHLPALFTVKLSKLICTHIFKCNSNKKKLCFAMRDFFLNLYKLFYLSLQPNPMYRCFCLCNYAICSSRVLSILLLQCVQEQN